MKTLTKIIPFAFALLTMGFGLAACDKDEGPVEETREAAEEVGEDISDTTEDMGDSMEEAADDVGDSVEDVGE